MQKKKHSFIEALVNTAIGYFITLIFSPAIYSLCGMKYQAKQLWEVVFLFTILSVVRSYAIRRLFNKKSSK